jgi:hypothetical protein
MKAAGRRGCAWAVRAAAALAALAFGLGCGSERGEPAPAAPAPATVAPGAEAPPAPAPADSGAAEELAGVGAASPAERTAPVGLEGAREARRARAALTREERREIWRKRLGIPEDPAERQRLRERAAEQDRVRVPQLDAEDPALRVEAVRSVDLQGPGRERVFALSIDDPLPAVRAAALERLYEEDAATARQIAQRGLSDREPEVLLAAIGVLGVVGDASNVAALEILAAEHEDERVREAAAEVVEALR